MSRPNSCHFVSELPWHVCSSLATGPRKHASCTSFKHAKQQDSPPRRGKVNPHFSQVAGDVACNTYSCEARPKALLVLFPSHAKHRALSWMFTGAAACKRCEQMHNHQLGTRQPRAKRKSSPCTLPFPTALDFLFARFAALRIHMYVLTSHSCKKRLWRPREKQHLVLRASMRSPALRARLRPPLSLA